MTERRPRGRPPTPQGAMSNAERQRRYVARKRAAQLSTPEVEIICILKKKPLSKGVGSDQSDL